MTPLLNLIQQREKELSTDETIFYAAQNMWDRDWEENPKDKETFYNLLHSFNRSTIISLLTQEIEHWEKKIFNLDDVWTDWGNGRNDAIREIISHYQSVLDGLKKSI